MIVKERKPIQFINDCECNVDLNELEKAINWYSDKPVTRQKRIFMHGSYPAVAIYKDKVHVHRLLMMYWLQRRLLSSEYVHHVNEQKRDASKQNLELIAARDHQSKHNKGKKFTAEHRAKISDANRKRVGIKYRKA